MAVALEVGVSRLLSQGGLVSCNWLAFSPSTPKTSTGTPTGAKA